MSQQHAKRVITALMSEIAWSQQSVLTPKCFGRSISSNEGNKVLFTSIAIGDFLYADVRRISKEFRRGHVLPESDSQIKC